jgi:hypothetical protein
MDKTVLFISNLCAKVPALIIQGFVELLSDGQILIKSEGSSSLQLITCSCSLSQFSRPHCKDLALIPVLSQFSPHNILTDNLQKIHIRPICPSVYFASIIYMHIR